MEHNTNHIIPSCYHPPVSYRVLLTRCDSLGTYKRQFVNHLLFSVLSSMSCLQRKHYKIPKAHSLLFLSYHEVDKSVSNSSMREYDWIRKVSTLVNGSSKLYIMTRRVTHTHTHTHARARKVQERYEKCFRVSSVKGKPYLHFLAGEWATS